MSLQTVAPDVLMTCPLDDAHRILKSRMQFHLVRCLKNHTLEKKIRCPWNPLHIVNRFEYLDHCNSKCEDLANVMGSKILSEDDAHRDVASIPVNAINAALPATEEDWDAQPSVGTYDPLKRTEGKSILRQSIGLSKAKRKAFIQQERKRHQQLDDDGPIQNPSSKPVEKIDSTKACRPLRKQQIAMSIDVSLKEESSSNIEDDDTSASTGLRKPHKPCSALIYEAIKDAAIEDNSNENNVKLFDAQFDNNYYGGDTASQLRDAKSRYGNSPALQKFMQSSSRETEKNLAGFIPCNTKKTEENDSIKVEEMNLLDEASNLPENHQLACFEDATVGKLAEQLANLESMQKQIDEKKKMILRELSRSEKKCLNSESNNASNMLNGNESTETENETIMKIESPLAKHEHGFINRKCAANFGKTRKLENLPIIGTGRGIVVDFQDYKNIRPGNRENQESTLKIREHITNDTKENTNPFLSVNHSMKNGKSFYDYEIDN